VTTEFISRTIGRATFDAPPPAIQILIVEIKKIGKAISFLY
jgi:hypothetical protein